MTPEFYEWRFIVGIMVVGTLAWLIPELLMRRRERGDLTSWR